MTPQEINDVIAKMELLERSASERLSDETVENFRRDMLSPILRLLAKEVVASRSIRNTALPALKALQERVGELEGVATMAWEHLDTYGVANAAPDDRERASQERFFDAYHQTVRLRTLSPKESEEVKG